MTCAVTEEMANVHGIFTEITAKLGNSKGSVFMSCRCHRLK